MKTKILLSILLFSISLKGFCTTWTIENTTTGFHFTPDLITIALGDDVNFILGPFHDALEVTEETWLVNGITAKTGGFQTPFGGGFVSSAQLTVGTHWYVCENHGLSGMKGKIIVSSLGLPENQLQANISIYPNPTSDIIQVKVNGTNLGSTYVLSDEFGKQLIKGSLFETNTYVDISNLPVGLYFFQVAEKDKRTFKVLKQ